MFSRQRLFRAQAIEQYAKTREQAVLPRLAAPPIFLCLWLLLGLLLLTTVLAWQVQVPLYTRASGALLDLPSASQSASNEEQVLLFVPAIPLPRLQVGDALTLQLALTGDSFSGTIAAVLPGILTPVQAREQYGLTGDLALVITQPSVVVQVQVGPALPAGAMPGSSVTAQVPVGEQSVLSLLPHLFSGLIGG